MHKQQLKNTLQSYVDYPITENIMEQVEYIGGLNISIENALLILEEIHQQNKIFSLFKSMNTKFENDENIFISKTIERIKNQEAIKTTRHNFWNIKNFAAALSVLVGLLLIVPMFQINTKTNNLNTQATLKVTVLQSIENPMSEAFITDLLQLEDFGQDTSTLYLGDMHACFSC